MREQLKHYYRIQGGITERERIVTLLASYRCLDQCQHAVCRELAEIIGVVNRGDYSE